MPDVLIRPAAAEDKAAWLPSWQGYLTFYETSLADEITERTWERLLDPAETMTCLVAVVDGKVLGFTHYLLHDNTWTMKQVCYLQDLFVDPEARNLGLGRALINAVADKAKELDCMRLYWTTKRDNATARALYDKVATDTNFMRYDFALT
ncbi:MAG: GNAT family N-acetyltransferase [Rhodospirillaceae bacterium]